MRRSELLAIVRSLLPEHVQWPSDQDVRVEGGRTVLMVVATVPDPKLAVRLIDVVLHHHTDNFWERDDRRRHVLMHVCHSGVHPCVLLKLVKWARRTSLKVVIPMSRKDADGKDAVELAIQGGHGPLASCLLGDEDPIWSHDLLCRHSPLEVLQLAIESRDEQCALDVLNNNRVRRDLQPGAAARLNTSMRWEQRRVSVKKLYNVFTCVGAAVKSAMPAIVDAIHELNPKETEQAVWYVLYKQRESAKAAEVRVHSDVRRMASKYLLDMLGPQLRDILLVRQWELLAKQERERSLWKRVWRWRRGRRDWERIANNQWVTLPNELVWRILSFLLPAEAAEAKKVANVMENGRIPVV